MDTSQSRNRTPADRVPPEGGSRSEECASSGRSDVDELPHLPSYPHSVRALVPPPTAEGWRAAVGYALRTLGLPRRVRRCRRVGERRVAVLREARQDRLVAIGQRAWDDEIPTEALSAHRAAIEQARGESADLEGQIAALDAILDAERRRVRTANAAGQRRAEGLERQYAEKDRVYQHAAREAGEATAALRGAEKELAAYRKQEARLRALPEDRRQPDHPVVLEETTRDAEAVEGELPALRERVAELGRNRDAGKEALAELRDQIRVERALLESAQKALETREREVDGQKDALRGAIAGAAASLRGPLAAAGVELFARPADLPRLSSAFDAVDRLDEALAEEDERAARLLAAEETFQPARARHGWLVLGGAAATASLVALLLFVVLGRADRTVAGLAWRKALPSGLDAVVGLDVDRLTGDPDLRSLAEAISLHVGARPPFSALSMAGVSPLDLASVSVGFAADRHGRRPMWLLALEIEFDPERLESAMGKAGYEALTAESGAARFVHADKGQLVAIGDRLLLFAPPESAPLLDRSPALRVDVRPAAADDPRLDGVVAAIDRQALLWAVGVVPAGVEATLGVSDAPPAGSLPGGEGGVRLALSLGFGDTLDFHVRLLASDESGAIAWETTARGWLEGGRHAWLERTLDRVPALASLSGGLAHALDTVSSERRGSALDLRGALSREWVRRLVEMLAPMLPSILGRTLSETDARRTDFRSTSGWLASFLP